MPQADDETYSFMFTDVESSSVLWEDYGEAMGRSLELHDDIIRNVSAAHDGHIVKHLGDGMYVVFETAPSAVGCAVALMAALQAEEFPELNDPLKVRIGVHTGSARARDGDYFGRAVNRAARVSDTANGDQIVVSEATKELCPDVDFDDHGTHELKGVGVERLYLLRSPRLKVDDRPLRVSKPSNLPTDSSAFIGRSEEVTGIAERLDEARGMTLVGPGGVGKTRLALRVAKHIAPRFPDGAFLCPLDSVAAADSVGPAVAEVLGATAIPGMTYAASIGTYLERRKALIILDNCEHVLGEARAVADAILDKADGCCVLATSREPLNRAGESLHPVAPLDAATEGVDLMLSRIQERTPEYQFDTRTRRIAVDVCQRLDGLPLAIELAAARLNILPIEELGSLLADRFRLLSGRNVEGRHATLLQTIRWSYDMLSPAEQRLFSELSVFRGGFTLDSVNAVCSAGDYFETLDLLTSLVEKSMVQTRSGLGSDRMLLLESLREFGAQQLDEAGLTAETTNRHTHRFGQVANDQADLMFTADEPQAWPVLEQEWDNIRAAFENAMAADDLDAAAKIVDSIHYWSVLAMRFEGLNWAHSWLAAPGADEHPRLATMQAIASSASYYAMDLDQSLALSSACMEGGATFDAMPFVSIWAYLAGGRVDEAEAFVAKWEEAEARARTSRFERAMVGAAASVLYGTMLRDEPRTREWLDRLDHECDGSGSPSAIAYAAMVRGMAVARLDSTEALEALKKAEDTSRALRDRHAYIDGSQTATAQIMATDSDTSSSVKRCVEALETALQHRFLPRIAHDLQSAAITLARTGEPGTAARLLGAAGAMGYRRWERAHGIVRRELDDDADFNALLELGSEFGPFDAVELALATLTD